MKRTPQEAIMAICVNLEMALLATKEKQRKLEEGGYRPLHAEHQAGKAAAFLEAINLIKTETQGIES